MKENILITGGAGFIGSRLSRKLIEEGHNVTILDNLNSQIHTTKKIDIFLKKNSQFIIGDIRNTNQLLQITKKNDIVFHLASETGTGQSMYEIKKYFDTNVNGTASLIHTILKSDNTKKIILSSSRSIYGEGQYNCVDHGLFTIKTRHINEIKQKKYDPLCPKCKKQMNYIPSDENTPLNPVSTYALTKKMQEEIIYNMSVIGSYEYSILRYQNVYGPGQSLNNPYTGILAIFSNLARLDKDIEIYEDGKESRDFIYVDDVVDITARNIAYDLNVKNKIINIGTGKRTTVLDIAKKIIDQFGSKSRIKITGSYRVGDIRHASANIKLMKKIFNIKSDVDIDRGVKEFVNWVSQNKIGNFKGYEKSKKELIKKNLMK